MHVGGLQVFELPADAGPNWLQAQLDSMLAVDDVAPFFRKRPYRSWRTGGQWAWEDDDQLDIEYHVRHSALPSPGRVRELLAAGGRWPGSLLDRQRPLGEVHVVEGLNRERFAIYTKMHHAMVDGVSSLRLLERSLSTDSDATVGPPWTYRRRADRTDFGDTSAERSRPDQADTATESGADPLAAVAGLVRSGLDLAGVAPALLRSARQAMDEELAAFPFKAPPTMLNVHITGARRIAAETWSLSRVRAVAKASDATLNDIVLAMSATNMAPSPIVSMLGGGEGWRPPFNITISNVPGPRQPLYLNGAKLQGIYPMSIPYHGQALNITITSYVDNLEFGLTGCRRRVPHLQRLLTHLETSLVELETAVGLAGSSRKRSGNRVRR